MQLSSVALRPSTQVVKPIVNNQPEVARVEASPLPVLKMAETTKGLVSIPSLVDAVLRGVFRFVEATVFSNPITSTVFRFFSEAARHGTTGTIRQAIDNRPVTSRVWIKTLRDSLENTVGKVVFNTNVSGDPTDGSIKNSAMRVLKGFGNWVVRVGYRLALIALDYMDPSEIASDTLVNESIGKSVSRALCLPSDNALIGIGSRIAEQAVINGIMEHLPFTTQSSSGDKTAVQNQSSGNKLLAA